MTGVASPYSVRRWRSFVEPDVRSRALVLPRAHWAPDNPLLFLAATVLSECGYEVWVLSWQFDSNGRRFRSRGVRSGGYSHPPESSRIRCLIDSEQVRQNTRRLKIHLLFCTSMGGGTRLLGDLAHPIAEPKVRCARLPRHPTSPSVGGRWS